jgi:hypothetical protein
MVRYLFPNRFKLPGLILFSLALFLGILNLFYSWEPTFLNGPAFSIFGKSELLGKSNNYLDEITSIVLIIGGLLAGFSKEKTEDEYIAKLRLESLVWSVYVNYGVLILTIILVSGLYFFTIMVINMFTLLIFFVIRFNLILFLNSRRLNHEE